MAAVPKETAADTPLTFSQKGRSWLPRSGVVVSCGEMNSPPNSFKNSFRLRWNPWEAERHSVKSDGKEETYAR